MNAQEVLVIVRDLIRNNLTDVYTSRDTEWIYTDKARCNLALNMFPRVLIEYSEIPRTRLGIGNMQTIDTIKVKIHVKCLVGNKYTYKEKEYTGEELALILSAEIDNLIRENHAYFVENSILYVFPVSGPYKEFDSNKNITSVLTLDAQFVN